MLRLYNSKLLIRKQERFFNNLQLIAMIKFIPTSLQTFYILLFIYKCV